ncbi:MAG: p-hydroxybenzoic acid efflux pump subunit AaeA [Anaerolineales bacterium]|nr:p-hydroxybenzoic acid efflux pump subunit AaeA [Anaerolineales bacterium]
MNHKRPPVPAIILLVLIIALSAYFFYTQNKESKNGALAASGFIEATQINVAPELAGKVTEVLVAEGDSVRAGDPLLRLDPSLLTAQRAVASAQVDSANAALASAQNQYDLAAKNAIAAQQGDTTKDWRFSAPDEFNQPAWYFTQTEEIQSIQTELAAALSALESAQGELNATIADLNNADFLAAETRLADARAAFLVADAVKTSADFASEGGSLQSAAQDAYNAALDELNAAQEAYNSLLNSDSAKTVQDARGKVAVAQLRYDTAYARLLALQTGTDSPAVVSASKALDQAKTAVAQAEASLGLMDAQIEKLTIAAPADGVVLTRNVEVGEFVQPGATALIIGQLDDLTITVFVPEDRFGEIQLGQSASVTVDSFPGIVFTATVIQISDKAEFTPRNVQTVEGRSSTVFAIKLTISNADGKLKIGMPADVVFK